MRRECTMQCAMFLTYNIKRLMLRHAYKKAATKAPRPRRDPAARVEAAPVDSAPVPEAVEEPEPEADESVPEAVGLALLEAAEPVALFRMRVVELLALTM